MLLYPLQSILLEALTVDHSSAGPHLVFFVLNVIEGLALLLTFKPFLTERKTPSEQLH
jgi:hypothetical protein